MYGWAAGIVPAMVDATIRVRRYDRGDPACSIVGGTVLGKSWQEFTDDRSVDTPAVAAIEIEGPGPRFSRFLARVAPIGLFAHSDGLLESGDSRPHQVHEVPTGPDPANSPSGDPPDWNNVVPGQRGPVSLCL